MEFFEEISLMVLLSNRCLGPVNHFKIGVFLSQKFIKETPVLSQGVYMPNANSFIQMSVPAKLYFI
jgi:hypothetical protein